MAVDGTLKFDTKIDTDGVEKGTESIKDIMKKLIASIENLSKTVDRAINNIDFGRVNSGLNQTEQSANKAKDSIVDMGNTTSNAMSQAEMSTEELERAMEAITVTRYNDIEESVNSVSRSLDKVAITATETAQNINKIDDSPIVEIKQRSNEFSKTLLFIKDTFSDIPQVVSNVGQRIKNAFSSGSKEVRETENSIQRLVNQVDTYKDALYSLQSKGLYFGDREYDEAYTELYRLERQLNEYKKTLINVDGEQKKVAKSADKANISMKKANKTSSSFSKTMGMLGKSLMFSIVFRAFSSVMNAVKEGFQNLAQYSSESNKNMSALATSMQTLKNSFATAFSPILTAITPALQTLINYLSQAITVMGQFFAVLLNGSTTFTKAKDAQVDYAKSLQKTGKAANGTLSPIDKLNNVGDSSGGAGSYEAPNPAQMFEEVEIDNKIVKFVKNLKKALDPTIKAFDRFKTAIEPFSKNVGNGLKWLYDNVLVPLGKWTVSDLIPGFLDLLGAGIGVLNSVIEVFKPLGLWLWENFLKPIATFTGGVIVDVLKSITDGLNLLSDWIMNNQDLVVNAALLIGSFFAAFQIVGFITAIAPLITTLGTFISSGGLLSGVLAGLSTVLSVLLSPVTIIATILGLLIYTFLDLYSSSEEFRNSISELGKTWMDALKPLADFIGTVMTDAWNEILKPVINFFLTTLLPNLIDTFKNLWQKVLVPLADFIGTVLQPIFEVIADILTSLWKKVVLPLAKAIGGTLKEAWDGIYQIMNKTVIPILSTVISTLKKLWEKVINPLIAVLWDKLKPAFDTVFEGIGKLIDGLKTTLSGIITFITGVFTGDWSKAWEGVKKIFKGIFDSLEAVVKTPVNAIIDIINGMISGITSGINAVIRSINSINFTLPDWVPGVGGKGIGFNLKEFTSPKIPKLATGAVIPPNSEFLAILGDQKRGTNIEAPLDTIVEAFRRVNGESGSGTELHLHVYEDGKQRYETVVKYEKENYNKTGKSVFVH